MSNILIALAALLLICSLGLNVIQFLSLRIRNDHIKAIDKNRQSLRWSLARTSMFVVRVQQADELYQASVKDGCQ